MAEVLFYHLERQPLDRVLPGLLEKCLERDWRVVVQLGSEERLEALDAHLWTYRDDSFLPHGTRRDGHGPDQPIWLTAGDDNPNGAVVRFVADGADLPDPSDYQRVVMLFDGQDGEAVARAREAWKGLKGAGHDITYWQQSENGRWERKG